ncbi:hypothetical protein CU097_010943 [Rhizopus azygosporus]|uniref:NADH dehydrogenase, alpha subcomplex, subunit 6 n=3 Tax=Rhizopus TaxID=4842 RepID=A0A2G4SHD7_RHIZD|nr:uncharacterized protein RHIMIDRAFT_208411 [Rhizopus microsporus ATCC 52813]ORE10503.1 hypothetical protein BCV72DRAFT_199609 [Rhizopus microsporus var. microsporus]PHZ08174.1 hypothetical protein RHIMIDRAFT_208411 [Rhizopus microsporus ATCC 52813]RCH94036.1 hypothetical protein CU097_010943 [Rhizopus azygosporus]CEG68396.1 Putative NADH dehydrogenase (Ubiquinone) 1 alpha subcomplex 6 [Rhizopus microsporus]
MSSAVFGVANLAVTTASAKSSNEARSRAIALYRRFQKSVPDMMKIHELNLPTSAVRAKIREEFERHRFVENLQVCDILYAKGEMEYQEIMNVWKQTNHIMNYFAKEEAPAKPTTFLEKFYEGRS